MLMKSQNIKLYPNSHMRKYIDDLCSYRRYCWNQALEYWDDQLQFFRANQLNKETQKILLDNGILNQDELDNYYNDKDIFKFYPKNFKVLNYFNELKNQEPLIMNWQKQYIAHIMQWAVRDLAHAFDAYYDMSRKDAKYPKFYSKKRRKQSFKTECAKIINGKLRLPKAHKYKEPIYDIRMCGLRKMNGQLKLVNIKKCNDDYIATLTYDVDESQISNYTNKVTGIDINVGHLDYTEGKINVLNNKIDKLYRQNKHYQWLLARKREEQKHLFKIDKQKRHLKGLEFEYQPSHKYQKVLNKLRRNYVCITNIQNDIYHKFSKYLVENYDWIAIEDLDVKHMQMSHVASKGMQRTGFAKLRRLLEYKCQWYGKYLVLADRYYPSTQICSKCGHRKTGKDKIGLEGNKKYKTKHEEYICYECGFKCDRDKNAVINLYRLGLKAKNNFNTGRLCPLFTIL